MKDVVTLKYHDTGIDSLSGKKHFHDNELEILHIVSGNGVMMIKDKLYPLSDNTIFFVCGRDAHFSSPQIPKEYIRNKIVFSEKLLCSLCEHLGTKSVLDGLFYSGNGAVSLSAGSSIHIDECFLKMTESQKQNEEIQSMQFASNIFSILITASMQNSGVVPYIKNKISDVIEYINRNLSEKLTLDSVANAAYVSKYYLSHTFKNTVGMTVFEYITFTRISKAKQLLRKTDDSITDICFAAGFDDLSYFGKVFREYEGITPREYRKKSAGI